jgi:ABC-2 type transport system permease protein
MSIVIYGQTIMSGVLEEKTSRVAEVVMSSVPTDTLLAGKVLGVGAVGLTQQIIWIATTYVLLKLRSPIMAKLGAPTVSFSLPDISLAAGILFLLFFLLGFIFYSSLYAAVGSSVNSESEARQAATPLLVMIVSTGVFIQSYRYHGARVVAGAYLFANHHAHSHGCDGGTNARSCHESWFSRDRMRHCAVAGIAHLPRRNAHVREETDDEGNG